MSFRQYFNAVLLLTTNWNWKHLLSLVPVPVCVFFLFLISCENKQDWSHAQGATDELGQAIVKYLSVKYLSCQSTSLGMMTSLEVGSLDSSLSDFQPESIAMDTIVFGNSSESIDAYIKKVSERIKRAQRFARTANVNKGGIIDVQFVLDQKGDLISVKVSQSSGSKTLDQMALAVVQLASPFSKLPDDYSHNEPSLILPIIFQIQANWPIYFNFFT